MHVDGVSKVSRSLEQSSGTVRNHRRILVSELSGTSNVSLKTGEMGLEFDKNAPEVRIFSCGSTSRQSGYAFESDASSGCWCRRCSRNISPRSI